MYSDTYKIPGNYYCPTTNTALTLKNCPCTNAFTMKVELGAGTGYPQQIFKNLFGQRYFRVYNSDNGGWKNDVEIVTSPGLGINTGVRLNSGFGVYAQVGNSNDYTRFVVNNKWVVIEHFTNGVKDKSVPLWDGK